MTCALILLETSALYKLFTYLLNESTSTKTSKWEISNNVSELKRQFTHPELNINYHNKNAEPRTMPGLASFPLDSLSLSIVINTILPYPSHTEVAVVKVK